MNSYTLLPDLVWNWKAQDEKPGNEEGTLLVILAGIAETGSVAQAARACGFSYRYAWGLVRTWEERLQQPLVDMARGRGSSLAPLGLRLVAIDARLKSRFAAPLAAATEEVRRELAPFMVTETTQLILHASHDPMLARLPEVLRTKGVALELHVLGSTESLASFAAGRCDLAGFHCPEGALGEQVWSGYRHYLEPRSHVLIRFARRTQGLMVAQGNPKQINGLEDLTRAGLRFVNRQAGAGTRLLLDLLLAEKAIKPQDIYGYEIEEFTHAAVAATIASGAADAGIGVEAAARRFGLDFIPLTRETYYLAARRDALTVPAMRDLQAALAAPAWRRKLAAEPGYEATGCGRVLECESAWGALPTGPAGRGK